MKVNRIIQGDALEELKKLPDESIDMVVTSPPYHGLRDYQVEGQIGLEETFEEYLQRLLAVTEQCQRVLKEKGTLWWVHGDGYGSTKQGNTDSFKKNLPKYEKCLIMQPYRLAQRMIDEQGWILRNIIIWYKESCMPESVKDRFTVDFEPVLFFSKSKQKSNDIKKWLDMPLKKEDASWLAAIIDGEGTIGIRKSKPKNRKNPSYQAYISVSNSCKNIVQKCVDVTGLGKVNQSTSKVNFPIFNWQLSTIQAISIIGEIYPYLIQKREQAKVCIAVQKLNKHRGNPNGMGGSKQILSDKNLKEKERLWKLGKKLNQKEITDSELPEPNLNRFGGPERYYFEQQFENYKSSPHGGQFGQKSIDKNVQYEKDTDKNRFYGKKGRNKRTVWSINPKPFPEAHFAVYPEELIETPIKAGCPEEVCKKCDKPKEIKREVVGENVGHKPRRDEKRFAGGSGEHPSNKYKVTKEPACDCNVGFKPGIVLDPFMGAGTTAVVARKLGRNWLGIELNPDYIKIAEDRLAQQVLDI